MTTEALVDKCHFIAFRLAEEIFAIAVSYVREVVDLRPITRVPTAPEYMRGVVNVRGKAVPVVDLRRRFGLPPLATTPSTRILIFELVIEGELCVVGGLADSVHDVIEVNATDLEGAPGLATTAQSHVVQNLIRLRGELVLVLCPHAVFHALDGGAALRAPGHAA